MFEYFSVNSKKSIWDTRYPVYFIFVLILLVLLLAGGWVSYAGQKTAILAWEQEITDDFGGWHVYHSLDNSSWERFCTIEYTGPQDVYKTTKSIQSPDGQEQEHFLYMTAYDLNGNESDRSNIASVVADLKAPNSTKILNFEIKPVQNNTEQ